jgi:hypothetical protein
MSLDEFRIALQYPFVSCYINKPLKCSLLVTLLCRPCQGRTLPHDLNMVAKEYICGRRPLLTSGGTPFDFVYASLLRIACFRVVCLIFSNLLAGRIFLFFII